MAKAKAGGAAAGSKKAAAAPQSKAKKPPPKQVELSTLSPRTVLTETLPEERFAREAVVLSRHGPVCRTGGRCCCGVGRHGADGRLCAF